MVALNPHFTFLALFCSLAALSMSPSIVVNAAALQARYDEPASHTGKPVREQKPMVPLPARAKAESAASGKGPKAHNKGHDKKKENKTSKKGKQQQHHEARVTEWSPANQFIRLIGNRRHSDTVYDDYPDVEVASIAGIGFGEGHQEHFQHMPEDVQVHRRSPVIIPNDHGGTYVVSHRRRSHNRKHHDHIDRQESLSIRDQGPTAGIINIMSDERKLASLFLTNTNGTYVLSASDTNQTQMRLVDASTSSPQCATMVLPAKCVNVQVDLPDQLAAGQPVSYITFDPSPAEAEMMTVEPCYNSTQTGPHKSQMFVYDTDTGVIRPMWFATVGDDGTDTTDTSGAPANDSAEPTPQAAGVASATAIGARDDSTQGNGVQNVTLVFLAGEPNAASAKAVDEASTSSGVLTSTATETMTVTVTSTDTVVPTSSLASMADVELTSATVPASSSVDSAVSSTTVSVEAVSDIASTTTDSSASTLASASVEALSNTILTSAFTSTTASASAVSDVISTSMTDSPTSTSMVALNVEVVAPSSSPSTPVSTTVDPTAVASSIAAAHYASSTVSSAGTDTPYTSAPSAAAMDIISGSGSSAEASVVSDAAVPLMTPVSTASYEWMFKAEARL